MSRSKRWAFASSGPVVLGAGLGGGQLLLFLAAPILARQYEPSDFGIYATVLAFAALAGPMITLKLENIIPIETDESLIGSAVRLSLFACVAGSTAIVLTCLGVSSTREGVLPADVSSGPVIWSLGAICLLSGWFSIFVQLALRGSAYRAIASANLSQAAATGSAQVSYGAVAPSFSGLLWGGVAGKAIGIVGLSRLDRRWLLRSHSGSWRLLLARYWRFPVVFAPSAVLNALGLQLPLLMTAIWFSAENTGQLSLAQRFTIAPSMIIVPAAGQYFVAELSKRIRGRAGGLRQLYLRTTYWLLAPGLLIMVGAWAFGPAILVWILGHDWAQAGQYSQVLGFSTGLSLIVAPLSYVLLVLERARLNLALDVLRVVAVGGAGGAAVLLGVGPVSTALGMYLSMCGIYVITWLLALRLVSNEDLRMTLI